MIHQILTVENQPVHIQRREPVSSLSLVTPVPAEVENPAHFRENRPAEHTIPLRINTLFTKSQTYEDWDPAEDAPKPQE